jgi:flagellar motor protein MotB
MATSPALAWSLANNISQEQFDKSIVDAIKLGESKGLSDAQFESLMNQYQISAADVARATQSTAANIQSRMEAATPTTQTEIAYNQAAMDELAKREAQWAAQQKQNAIDWTKQQQTNTTNWAEQQRLNELKNAQQIAANQKAYEAYLANQAKLAAEQATKTTGFQTSAGTLPFANATQGFAQNFQNYQSIAPGAQYNPAVMPGGASPYSLIMGQMQPMGNPYAGVVAGQAMGGYNPGLYDQIAQANVARAAAANTGVTLADYYGGGGDGNSTAAGEGPGGNSGGGEGNGATAGEAGAGYAMGGMVDGLFGMNPPGPDDGAGYLDRGEYVVKKSAVNKYGRGLLDMINEGKVPAKKLKSLLG